MKKRNVFVSLMVAVAIAAMAMVSFVAAKNYMLTIDEGLATGGNRGGGSFRTMITAE